jgi:hypothetical protein
VTLSLFFLKVAVPPILVALMSLAARRWGATVGGLIMGLPWMTGPVLFFLTLDKGVAFAVEACVGIELGAVCIAAFVLGYGAASRRASWPLSLAAAALSFAAIASGVRGLDFTLWQAAALGASALLATFALLPKPNLPQPNLPQQAIRMPRWDIPARMIVTFLLVAGIMLSADQLGSQLSGIVATFPVILTVVGSFTHHQLGSDAVLRVLRGISLSLLGFVLFFVVVGFALPKLGLALSFLLAASASLAFSAAMIAVSQSHAT